MNPDHPVVQLCASGIQAEMSGDHAAAKAAYEDAWSRRTDAFGACVAAHYLARQQNSLEEGLRWNREALEQAAQVTDGSVDGFYPSLYLNLGFSHEMMGDGPTAREFYMRGIEAIAVLGPDPYGETVREALNRRLAMIGDDAGSR